MSWRDALLAQARADWAAYRRMSAEGWPLHDRMHYLQMACEKLGKAAVTGSGAAPQRTHVAFGPMVRALGRNRRLRELLGPANADSWRAFIGSLIVPAEMLESLAPALALGANPEYPWETRNAGGVVVVMAPCDFNWSDWHDGTDPAAARLLKLVAALFENFERVFG